MLQQITWEYARRSRLASNCDANSALSISTAAGERSASNFAAGPGLDTRGGREPSPSRLARCPCEYLQRTSLGMAIAASRRMTTRGSSGHGGGGWSQDEGRMVRGARSSL